MPWNPEIYNKFKSERFAPFFDLIEPIQKESNMNVIDLGCGTGELTQKLAYLLPQSQVTGIDSSEEMLKESLSFSLANLTFKQKSVEQSILSGLQYDLVFSNAAIQWIENHQLVLPKILSLVKNGGQVAIQMPSNHEHFTHTAIRKLALKHPYAEALNGWFRVSPVLSIETYASILYYNNFTNIEVIEKAYPHVLENASALADWTSGTALIPYLERLPLEMRKAFFTEYKTLLQNKYPESPVFYPFKRILMYGRKTV